MKVAQTLFLQTIALLGGTIFEWSQVIPQFRNFYATYGTLFRLEGCVIPNPLATACFYGSIAFLIALIWSFSIMRAPNYTRERYLKNFLIFCVIFACSVVMYETVDYYKLFGSEVGVLPVSCTPGVAPFQTPCFYGMLFFIASLVASIFGVRKLKYN